MTEIILIILILSYREIGHLCERHSYDFAHFKRIYWETDQNNFWLKNWNWFHVSNGLATLIICYLFAQNYQTFGHIYIDTPFYWVCWMYLRNVVMHVILPYWRGYNPQLRLWYLVPLFGGYLDKKFRQ